MGALLRNCTLKSVPQISLTDFEATWKENEIYCINKTKFTTFKICQADHKKGLFLILKLVSENYLLDLLNRKGGGKSGYYSCQSSFCVVSCVNSPFLAPFQTPIILIPCRLWPDNEWVRDLPWFSTSTVEQEQILTIQQTCWSVSFVFVTSACSASQVSESFCFFTKRISVSPSLRCNDLRSFTLSDSVHLSAGKNFFPSSSCSSSNSW